MKKIVLEFSDGHKMDIFEDIDKVDLAKNLEEFYDKLHVSKLNEEEYKLSGFEDEYQILNIKTKEIYNHTNQNGVVKVEMILEEKEFNSILETVKKKENENNN